MISIWWLLLLAQDNIVVANNFGKIFTFVNVLQWKNWKKSCCNAKLQFVRIIVLLSSPWALSALLPPSAATTTRLDASIWLSAHPCPYARPRWRGHSASRRHIVIFQRYYTHMHVSIRFSWACLVISCFVLWWLWCCCSLFAAEGVWKE